MAGEFQFEMQCPEVEALLAEALDGTLQGPKLAAFEAHAQDCASCRTMVADARAGMLWLTGLDEAEPPRNLVHNILAQTIGALPSEHAMPAPRPEGWFEKLKARLTPVFAPVATPRFAMSFGMAFFSITMLLGVAGFHLSDLRRMDLSSKAITKTYYATEARVIRYYENMRLVYEIESRVRDLKRAATPENNTQQPQQKQEAPATNQKNRSTSDNRQQQTSPTPNYSRAQGQRKLTSYAAVVPQVTPQARRQSSHPIAFASPVGALNRRLV
jgi:Putative zinc-finger